MGINRRGIFIRVNSNQGVKLSRLPVITGFGGVNAAGRSSFHHGFRRVIVDKLQKDEKTDLFLGLATMMGKVSARDGNLLDDEGNSIAPEAIEEKYGAYLLENTLVREMGEIFDPNTTPWGSTIAAEGANGEAISFSTSRKNLPEEIPSHWHISESADSNSVTVRVEGNLEFIHTIAKKQSVRSGGRLPSGFNPGNYYKSNFQPRGLQLGIYGACDALNSVGIDWETIKNSVAPDQIGVYSSSAMGQLDDYGAKGYLGAPLLGKRTSAKQLPLSLADMPANFINAYILGNVGYTCASIGACATFLYGLNAAIQDIRNGYRRVAIVGNSESPLVPEIFEGYRVMGALVEDSQLLKLDEHLGRTTPNYRTASRPFGENGGFVLGEASQYLVLMDDELAMELGAPIHGSIGDVFINADGYKKSISSPGFGNYITFAKTLASAQALFGEKCLQQRSFVHAHGSGTPQNRVTESHILNEMAKAYNISSWPVAAVKSYFGHSLATASGDQIVSSLGTWKYGWIPGIKTIEKVADDVHHSNLNISTTDHEVGPEGTDIAFVNSKGFGGNNATGYIISPSKTMAMLTKKHGVQKMNALKNAQEKAHEKAYQYDQKAMRGDYNITYKFGDPGILTDNDLDIRDEKMHIRGFDKPISLKLDSPYPDMTL